MSKKEPEIKKPPKAKKDDEEEEDEEIEGDEHALHAKENEEEEDEEEEENKEEKMPVEIKPRENYLKEKISSMGIEKDNPKAATGITKSLSEAMKKFEGDILSNQLLITEVQKDLSKLIPKESKEKYSNAKNFSSVQRLHLLKSLKKDENKIKMAINKLNEHEKLLESESYTGMKDPSKVVECNIRNDTLKKIKQDKQALNERLIEIEFISKGVLVEENNKDFKENHKEKMKNFYNNFEEDTKKIKVKAMKYGEGSAERIEKFKTEMDNIMEKRKKEIEEKEKEEQEKRDEKINKLREHERELITKRIHENNEKLLQLKKLEDTKIETPLHKEKEKKYKEKEEKRIKEELGKRKEIMKSIRNTEINEFSTKVKEKLQEAKEASEEKSKKLFTSWKENKKKIPEYAYTAPTVEDDEDEDIKKQKRTEAYQANLQAKKEYCENNIPKPIFDEKKKIELEKLNEKKPREKLHYSRGKRILLKKRTNQSSSAGKSKKYPWELKLDYVDKELEDKKKVMIQKKKPFYCSTIIPKKVVTPLEKPIDYLQEFKKQSQEKKATLVDTTEVNENKWEKKLKNKNNSVAENVESVRNQVNILDSKVQEEEQFLKLNGGIQNNPEVGQKVSNMMIDSIKAKLSLISLNKEYEQSKAKKIKDKLTKSRVVKKKEVNASGAAYSNNNSRSIPVDYSMPMSSSSPEGYQQEVTDEKALSGSYPSGENMENAEGNEEEDEM